MEGSRRVYSEEFKKNTVEHTMTSEKSVEELAKDLGIAHSNLRRWRVEYRKRGEFAFPGNGKQKLTSQEEKISRLKKSFTRSDRSEIS